ncbi:Glycosyl hydrolase, family 88 [Lactiplantibacillus pentosus KCA1]|nr:glycoside hydrolase family 88 protein [Lactiplantibacillus pentosus]EIW12521.1 Glycosyl hydrolase, family 88 [Lactiplantibacillus pentosus KCA1]
MSWIDDYLQQVTEKVTIESGRLNGKTPYIPYDGFYSDVVSERGIDWWSNGFWSGILWQLYAYSHQGRFKDIAITQEQRLDGALHLFQDLHHDVGFMWLLSSVAHYRVTGDEQARRTGIHAATLLAGRFNIAGKYLVSWNDHPGWLIVDSMMNIQLLYWASQQTGDPRFELLANCHADTVAKTLVRADGSVGHIASFNPDTGVFIEQLAGQGVSASSSWSRGNAWALYGFALTYRHTRNKHYLKLARKIADYFIGECEHSEGIPLADFRAPEEPCLYDTSAGMIAVSGLLEISSWLSEREQQHYQEKAKYILKAIVRRYANWNSEEDGIIGGGTEAYYRPATYEIPLIYTDYFFIESLLRLKGQYLFLW